MRMFQPKFDPFHEDLKAAALEGIRSTEQGPLYTDEEVADYIGEVIRTTPLDES